MNWGECAAIRPGREAYFGRFGAGVDVEIPSLSGWEEGVSAAFAGGGMGNGRRGRGCQVAAAAFVASQPQVSCRHISADRQGADVSGPSGAPGSVGVGGAQLHFRVNLSQQLPQLGQLPLCFRHACRNRSRHILKVKRTNFGDVWLQQNVRRVVQQPLLV